MIQQLLFLICFVSCLKLHETTVAPKPCPLMDHHRGEVNYRRQASAPTTRTYCKPWDNSCNKNTETWPPTTIDPNSSTEQSGPYMSPRTQKTGTYRRTIPTYHSFENNCNYLVFGPVCAKGYFFSYRTFPNYCLVEFMNCIETWNAWDVVYIGNCKWISPTDVHEEFQHYPYENDYFLDQYYPIEYGHISNGLKNG
ncbi:hypothetical protein NE865_01477 [Phthorimaea operculella]|nr:hypothetical protein NE865_01477 [Phthorimaea operculella]